MAALGNRCGAVVALEPKTGRVLVHAQSPTYDPNLVETRLRGGAAGAAAPSAGLPPRCSSARPTASTCPGSTFKVVTASAAIDSGNYSLRSTFQDPGYCIEYGKRVFNYSDQGTPSGYGTVNLGQAIQNSINSVFCNIGKDLGAGTLVDYAKRFGFYERPPLETPDERAGAERALPGREAVRSPGRLPGRPGPLRIRAGAAAGDADADGDGRGHDRQRRRTDGAARRRQDRRPRRRHDPDDKAEEDPPGRLAADRERGHRGDEAGGAAPAPRRRRSSPGSRSRARPAPPSRANKGSTRSPSSASRRPTTRRSRSPSSSSGSGAREARRRRRSRDKSCRPCSGRRRIEVRADQRTPIPHRTSIGPYPVGHMATTDTLIDSLFDRRYRILKRIGSGGMADVYLAEDEILGRRVAIKILNERHAGDDQFVKRFHREAQSAAALSHPNVVAIYDRGEARGVVLHRDGAPRRAEPEGARSSRAARRRRRSWSSTRARSSRRSRTRTGTGSCTATSSRTTSWSTATTASR